MIYMDLSEAELPSLEARLCPENQQLVEGYGEPKDLKCGAIVYDAESREMPLVLSKEESLYWWTLLEPWSSAKS